MKTEQCLMCIVCFVLGWFVHNVVGRCGFGREHLTDPSHDNPDYCPPGVCCAGDSSCSASSGDHPIAPPNDAGYGCDKPGLKPYYCPK